MDAGILTLEITTDKMNENGTVARGITDKYVFSINSSGEPVMEGGKKFTIELKGDANTKDSLEFELKNSGEDAVKSAVIKLRELKNGLITYNPPEDEIVNLITDEKGKAKLVINYN